MSPSEPSGASISDQPAAEGNLLTASCPLPITDYKAARATLRTTGVEYKAMAGGRRRLGVQW